MILELKHTFWDWKRACDHHVQEQEAFAKAASLDTHKALVHIFFAQRSTKKVSGVTDAGLKPRKVRKVAVIGGGLMGSGIATAGLLGGQEGIIKEVNDKFLEVHAFAAAAAAVYMFVVNDKRSMASFWRYAADAVYMLCSGCCVYAE